jgi:hypothetical protein
MPSAITPQIIEAPGLGLIRNVDPRHVVDNAWANGRNVRFPTGKSRARKTDGYRQVDATAGSEPIQGLWWYVDPNRVVPEALLRWTTSGVWNGLGFTLTKIADTPGRALLDVVTIDQYVERVVWADGLGVFEWNGTGLASPVTSGGMVAKLVEIHKDHVLLGNLTTPAMPWRVAYSIPNVGTPIDMTGSGSGVVNFLEDATPVTAMKTMGDHVVVHKANRLYRLIFVGPPDNYTVEVVAADEGSISARGPISVGSYQYYPGHTNVFRLGSFAEPIGDAIWPEIAAAIDWPRANLTYAYRRDEWDEICWKFPARGVAQPSLTAVYNMRDQTWTLTDHDPGTCYTQVPSDALVSTHVDDDAAPGSPPPFRDVFGQIDGKIHVYIGTTANGAPISAWIESKHFVNLAPAKILAVPVFAKGVGTLIVQLRAALDVRQPLPDWPTTPPVSARYPLGTSHTRPWVDVRVSGRVYQVRIESTGISDEWELEAYGPATIPGGYAR